MVTPREGSAIALGPRSPRSCFDLMRCRLLIYRAPWWLFVPTSFVLKGELWFVCLGFGPPSVRRRGGSFFELRGGRRIFRPERSCQETDGKTMGLNDSIAMFDFRHGNNIDLLVWSRWRWHGSLGKFRLDPQRGQSKAFCELWHQIALISLTLLTGH